MSLFRNIKWSPFEYADAAVIAQEAEQELLARLEWTTIKPAVVMDMGCGPGQLHARLQERYNEAQIFSLDYAETMLQHGDKTGRKICADATQLPLSAGSCDLIFSNFLLPWEIDFKLLLREWRRVLRPDSLLTFTALGPDTLKEWRGIFKNEEIPQLIDMHEIGDLLLKEGFADPVLDVEHYTISYKDKKRLFTELKASGMWFPPVSENPNLKDLEEGWEVTFEVIYVHAFVPSLSNEMPPSADGIVRVPLDQLRKQLRSREQ